MLCLTLFMALFFLALQILQAPLSEPRLYYTQILASAHDVDVCCRVAAMCALWLSRDGDATHEIHQLRGAPLLNM